MIINKISVSAYSFEKHLINRRRKHHWGIKAAGFSLMLTSMVDMFSMLVVFLLQTFSSSPEILVAKGIKLPNAVTTSETKQAPVLAISGAGNLYLDQKLVGKTEHIAKNPAILIKQLNKIKFALAKSSKGVPASGEINLQADQSIKSTTVAKIMGVLTSVDFQAIELAVINK